MKFLWYSLGLLLISTITFVSTSPCDSQPETDCIDTEYDAYTKCLESNKSVRRKRQAVCPFAEKQKECTQLNFDCTSNCNNDLNCVQLCPICPITDCENDCEASCGQDDSCHSECSDACNVGGYSLNLVDENGELNKVHSSKLGSGHNITTIIKLTNIVNNTNIVNVPTNINSTNINNIHVYANSTEGKYGLGEDETGSCCYAVRPKSCNPSSAGVRCHHRRHKTCGDQCTSRIIHVQSRKRCQMTGECQNRVSYVPQPSRQQCHYIDQWPHVSCGGGGGGYNGHGRMERTCDGCYDHYGNGYDNQYGGGYDAPDCNGCYDDAWDMGQYYRRGPVFRPFYYHEPPCYITGTCHNNYGNDCGYGCYGHENVDPSWGYNQNNGYDDGNNYHNDRNNDNSNIIYPDEFDASNENGSGFSEVVDNDWGVELQKCNVVEDDGTITIKNCTNSAMNSNPFAGSPVTNLHDGSRDSDYRRPQRHTDGYRRHRSSAPRKTTFVDDKGEFVVID